MRNRKFKLNSKFHAKKKKSKHQIVGKTEKQRLAKIDSFHEVTRG